MEAVSVWTAAIRRDALFMVLALAAAATPAAAALDAGALMDRAERTYPHASGLPGAFVRNAVGVESVACWIAHCVALRSDGTVLDWGDAHLGDGTGQRSRSAVVVKGLHDVFQVAGPLVPRRS